MGVFISLLCSESSLSPGGKTNQSQTYLISQFSENRLNEVSDPRATAENALFFSLPLPCWEISLQARLGFGLGFFPNTCNVVAAQK